ncbi:ABC transporter ATP-binding protein [Pelagibacterium halotolerans]|uniref:ABC transporter related protein n=1 Tax=Pelagibacterium halotolerans (strain DSM 22347 / JCM 15775 / CGMCC 1.7692 / B2) TaxID=1082931 RepID=G4RFG3_PELHB|nr:ABC transporter ATP-binding protein [Pelagibacterium halotolerans]AEQ52001.1 ABC transporter related protein [Pelagibacterium halotolerans B2]QJR18214.1 ABC transporter ATP-binding protein [Pelagibacterium halotolerans]SDZ81316.1 iron complex transport system ATP-binding protein [Pelagibacterium halotolerans]
MDDTVRVRISVEDLTLGYGQAMVLDALSLRVAPGQVTVLAGPNGCGKSTLLRAIRRLHRPVAGRILVEDIDVAKIGHKALARQIGLLAQSPSAPEEMTVEDLVRLGRYPHQSMLQPWNPHDTEAMDRAMDGTGVLHLRHRRIGSLSGGQLQRVWIAMVLAQETDIICLDEPVNHLDMAHQIECLNLVGALKNDYGRTVVLVLHDLNLAARHADVLVFLKDGKVVARGAPEDLMTPDTIEEVFGVKTAIITDPLHGRPLCIPQ